MFSVDYFNSTGSTLRKTGSGFVIGLALSLSFPASSWGNEAVGKIGKITFTADNAAQIFINGESLG